MLRTPLKDKNTGPLINNLVYLFFMFFFQGDDCPLAHGFDSDSFVKAVGLVDVDVHVDELSLSLSVSFPHIHTHAHRVPGAGGSWPPRERGEARSTRAFSSITAKA